MYSLAPFKIDLKGLHEGVTQLAFNLNDAYFEAIEADDVRRGQLDVSLEITRRGDFFECRFHIEGAVTIPCDLCLDDMQQPVDTEGRIAVKFGAEYAEEDDLVTINEEEGILDVAWLLYEFIVVAIPIRHVHAPGKCNPAMMEVLNGFSASRSGEADGDDGIDPRWASLKNLNIKE